MHMCKPVLLSVLYPLSLWKSVFATFDDFELVILVSFILAAPSCEVATTCAPTVLFPSPEEERGVDLSAPSWRRSLCSLIR